VVRQISREEFRQILRSNLPKELDDLISDEFYDFLREKGVLLVKEEGVEGTVCENYEFRLEYLTIDGKKGWCIGRLKKPPEHAPNDTVKLCFIRDGFIEMEVYLTPREMWDLGVQLQYMGEKNVDIEEEEKKKER